MVPQSTTQIPPAVKTLKLLMPKMTPCHTHNSKKTGPGEKILSELFLLTPSFRKHRCTKRYRTCTASAYQDQLMTFQCENVNFATISRRSPGHQKYWGVTTERPSVVTQSSNWISSSISMELHILGNLFIIFLIIFRLFRDLKGSKKIVKLFCYKKTKSTSI